MFKKFWKWIQYPYGWGLILFYSITVICITGAIVCCTIIQVESYKIFAYIFYALAAITFGYTLYTIIIYTSALKQKIKKQLKANEFTTKLLEDYDFRTTIFAVWALMLNIVFAIMNLISAFLYQVLWYGIISIYYFMLVFFRGGILFTNKMCAKRFVNHANEYEKSKWKIYFASGGFLILLEFAMIGAITQMILSKHPIKSGIIIAITNAIYTFYKVTMSIYNLVKARKFSNPVVQSLRNLNLADASMSIVSLTVLMLSTFTNDRSTIAILVIKSSTGFTVCVGIILMALFMMIKARKKLQLLKREFSYNQIDKII